MTKYPSEIFGFLWNDDSSNAVTARETHFCPFHGSTCFKQSRLVSTPFGVCTAHFDGKEIALCPRRFLDGSVVFRDIALTHFHSVDNIVVFSEIGLPATGSFDFVMVKHKPFSFEIEDFVVIELQTGQTTNTGKLVDGFKDFMKSRTFKVGGSYGFGINFYDIWKRTFTQILNKGMILERWQHRIFWVVQDPIFQYFRNKYRLGELAYESQHSSVFSLYDLKPKDGRLVLYHTQDYSSTIDGLFEAFRKNDEIPPVKDFIDRLQSKLESGIKLGLRLDSKATPSYFDAPKPTSSGKVREDEIPYGNERGK